MIVLRTWHRRGPPTDWVHARIDRSSRSITRVSRGSCPACRSRPPVVADTTPAHGRRRDAARPSTWSASIAPSPISHVGPPRAGCASSPWRGVHEPTHFFLISTPSTVAETTPTSSAVRAPSPSPGPPSAFTPTTLFATTRWGRRTARSGDQRDADDEDHQCTSGEAALRRVLRLVHRGRAAAVAASVVGGRRQGRRHGGGGEGGRGVDARDGHAEGERRQASRRSK